MNIRIRRASPHQNGKVLGILMAVTSLVFVVPIYLLLQVIPAPVDPQGDPIAFPGLVILLFPLGYLIMGYIGGAIASVCYNVIAGFVGGFEFELQRLE
jgi:hypothetical protein